MIKESPEFTESSSNKRGTDISLINDNKFPSNNYLVKVPTEKEKETAKIKAKNNYYSKNTKETSKLRTDAYGNEIKRGKHKKYKVTFEGFIEETEFNYNKFIKVIDIDNFKKYNAEMSYSGKEGFERGREAVCCSGCFIY